MIIACPKCSAGLDIPEAAAERPNKKVMCPACRHVFRMHEAKSPAEGGETAPPVQAGMSQPGPPLMTPSAPYIPQPSDPAAAQAAPLGPGLEADLGSAELDLGEVDGAPSAGRFEVDRDDYSGTTFDLPEMQDLVKRGWVLKSDRIRPSGNEAWLDASKFSGLEQAFALRQKQIAQKLQQMARKSSHPCEHHPKKPATHICLECARAFCSDCGNSAELGDSSTVLCLDCDAKMAPVGS